MEEPGTMRHFVVEATYLVPFDRIRETIPRHRAWLQKGYDLGLFLCSGPQAPQWAAPWRREPNRSKISTPFS